MERYLYARGCTQCWIWFQDEDRTKVRTELRQHQDERKHQGECGLRLRTLPAKGSAEESTMKGMLEEKRLKIGRGVEKETGWLYARGCMRCVGRWFVKESEMEAEQELAKHQEHEGSHHGRYELRFRPWGEDNKKKAAEREMVRRMLCEGRLQVWE